KDKEAKWQEFNKAFNQPEPASKLLKFRVVGIKSERDPYTQGQGGSNYTPEQIFDTAFNANAGQGWLTPFSVQDEDPTVATIFEQDAGFILGEMVTHYAEFSSAEDARQALLERTCTPTYGNEEKGLLGTKIETQSDV